MLFIRLFIVIGFVVLRVFTLLLFWIGCKIVLISYLMLLLSVLCCFWRCFGLC